MTSQRYILHIDMDAFFAAVEQRDDPSLRGKPVVIGADPKTGTGRGVVSTCSYEARRFGIHSAMPIAQAYKLCPTAIFLQPDMAKYAAVSHRIHEIFNEFTPDVEPISIDEAFLDITKSYRLFGKTPAEVALLIKKKIRETTGLTASVGLAPIMMAAKIASDLKKPDGFVEVPAGGVAAFLSPLPVRKLWGVGPKSEAVLHRLGLKTIGDVASRDVMLLRAELGEAGVHLWQLAQGIDERDVEARDGAQSVSNEHTFDEDQTDTKVIESAVLALAEKVSMRLRDDGYKGRTISIKLRYADFRTLTRSKTIATPTNFVDVIFGESLQLVRANRDTRKKVRLVGVKVANLIPAASAQTLFDEAGDAKKEKLHTAMDAIRRKYGDDVIHRARWE